MLTFFFLKGVEHGMQGLSLDVGSSLHHSQHNELTNSSHTKPDQPKEAVPKKMTWASIASQPAKPQIRVIKLL